MHSFTTQFHLALVAALLFTTLLVSGAPISDTFSESVKDIFGAPQTNSLLANSACFPQLGFSTPDTLPSSTDGWWCSADSEYAFLGFSYAVNSCQSKKQMTEEFKDIRERFQGRYIRMYSWCDKDGFYDDLIDAAYEASLGVHALIWFGFDGSDVWKSRRNSVMKTLTTNPKAPFVVRTLQFGSEPLFDHAISAGQLAKEVEKAKEKLHPFGIQVTVSDMAYGYQSQGGGQDVLDAIDHADVHTLPFFSTKASTGDKAWPIVEDEINWFAKRLNGKKIYLSQNGWPSKTYAGVRPNSAAAVANVKNEAAYYNMLDEHCSFFKSADGGGIGWFAHLYSEAQTPGYGILGLDGSPKFDFKPLVEC